MTIRYPECEAENTIAEGSFKYAPAEPKPRDPRDYRPDER